jgi:hypothetical protein
MARVDVSFQALDPIAVNGSARSYNTVRINTIEHEIRRRRLVFSRSHVRPDSTCGFYAGIGRGSDLVLKVAIRKVGRHVDTLSVNVKFPAMIDAHNSTILIDAKEQRCTSMGTPLIEEPYLALGVSEGN